MYAVIFKARTNQLDSEYQITANKMRELAIKEYACRNFVSVVDNDHEISISYWDSLDDIKAWRENHHHLAAQTNGADRWYRSIKIEVVELIREYQRDYASL